MHKKVEEKNCIKLDLCKKVMRGVGTIGMVNPKTKNEATKSNDGGAEILQLSPNPTM